MDLDSKLLSGKNLLWIIVIVIVVAIVIVFVMSRRDDNEPKEVQDQNDRNLLPWVVGIGAVILVVGLAYYYGLFGMSLDGKEGEESSAVTSSRGKTPSQITQDRLSKSRVRSAGSRSPPRGSLTSVRDE